MAENLDIYDITLSSEESTKILNLHQDTCDEDPGYYECAGFHPQRRHPMMN